MILRGLTSKPEVMPPRWQLLPISALVLIEFDADLPDGLATRRFWWFNAPLREESHRVFAEHLLNNKLQMSAFGATEGLATQQNK